jgi:uncharacterized lipoprotein NlpE involved in copper resistance
MNKLSFLFLLLIFILAGCNTQPAPTTTLVPTWILNPNQNGKSGAVGSSMQTYDQKISTQRKLAITRALDELSLQQGVEVNMNLTKQENYTNGNAYTQMDVNASYQSKSKISAHIEEVYQDKISGELFIWMVMD